MEYIFSQNNKKMKKLVLDDCPNRMAKFFANKGEEDLMRVWNAKDCIESLRLEEWDLVSLDHDLDQMPYDNPQKENTGSGVVRWIVANKPKVKRFVVHSYNNLQAPKMVEALKGAGYEAVWEPFNL